MLFDLLCAGLCLLLALFGLFRGLVRQVFGLAGFLLGMALSRGFAPSVGASLAQQLAVPLAVATVGASIAIFFVTTLLAGILGGLVHRSLGAVTGTINRAGGFALGGCKGLLVAWALASLVALVQPGLRALPKTDVLSKLDLDHSQLIAFARETNLINELRGKDGNSPKPRRGDGTKAPTEI